MNLWNLFNNIHTDELCFKYVTENLRLIDVEAICVKCKKLVKIYKNGTTYSFRCFNNSNHDDSKDWKQSVFQNTLFEKSNLGIRQHIIMLYCFSRDYTYNQIINECSILSDITVSSATVATYLTIYREAMHYGLFNKQLNVKLGGSGAIIEIDETLIGKRKFNKGRQIEGKWVLGMVERNTGNVRLAICPNNKRDKNTLHRLIAENINIGSTIHTDMWKGYSGVSDNGFRHKTVNHSFNFINPEDGTHTQKIEGTWSALKRKLRVNNDKLNLDIYLFEYMYRKYCKFHKTDIFNELAKDIRNMYSEE